MNEGQDLPENTGNGALQVPSIEGGLTVLLTRPRRESRVTACLLTQADINSIRMPLQWTRRAPRTAVLDADLAWAAGADLHVFVSRAAVNAAVALAPATIGAATSRIAVGRATALALAQRGLSVRTAAADAEDSDGVLALEELQDLRGQRCAIWAAPGGRERIADTLRTRGAELRVIFAYQRIPERPRPVSLLAARRAASTLVLTATSVALLEALDQTLVTHRLEALKSRPLIVASARIASRAQHNGFSDVHLASGASADALLATLNGLHGKPNNVDARY
jgi:uroporphyrinogen-III synthase